MNEQNHRNAVRYGMIAAVVMSITGILGGALPFVGILVYAAGVLFFTCTYRYGFIFTLPFLIFSYLFVSFGTSFSGAIADIIGTGLPAMLMAELIRINRSQGEALGKGILTAIICNMGSMICLRLVEKTFILQDLRESMNAVIDKSLESGEMTIYSAQLMKQAYETLFQIIPALLIGIAILGTLFIYFVGCSYLIKRGVELNKFMPFKTFSFSRNIIFGCLVILIFSAIAGYTGIVNFDVLMMNISVVIGVAFFVQGLSVIVYLWDLTKFPRIILIILLSLSIIFMVGFVMMFFIGLIDLVVNIRGRIEAKRRQE